MKPHEINKTYRSLSRVMSKQGLCSRSEAERLAKEGNVHIDGKLIRNPETLVAIDSRIEITGSSNPKSVSKKQLFYVVMNKRKGVVTTAKDELNRETVYDDLNAFLKTNHISERLFAVGRLDKESEGLLLFTNDNEFSDFLTNPKNQIPKTYRVLLHHVITDEEVEKIRSGIEIKIRGESFFVKLESLNKIKPKEIEITLTEGKNREVRRVFEAIKNKVEKLTRIQFADFKLEALLKSGECTEVKRSQILLEHRKQI
jgi:23S rRNA pseudouridine2605 synthase